MTFTDPESQRRRLARGRPGHATVELGHEGSRTGIIVQLDATSQRVVRMILERAFDMAGEQKRLRVDDPGWWALLVGMAALQLSGTASIQRVPFPGELHVVVRVERGRMLEDRPLWPMVRFVPDGGWYDLRGESALAHGPSDVELREYAAAVGVDAPVSELVRMFELGVLEWEPGAIRDGRRRLIHAR